MDEETFRKLDNAELYIERNPMRFGIELMIINREKGVMVDDFSFKELNPNEIIPNPPMIKPKMAQKMMDELWNVGIRPSKELGSVGQKDAIESHLSDMRKIVSSKLKIDL